MKKTLYILLTVCILINTCSCALLQKPIDKRTGFSNNLIDMEKHLRNEDWEKAKTSLDLSEKTWKKLKPLLQIDIDHDYVKEIEEDFIKLEGYIDTKDKAESLATILLVQDTWKNIGSL